MEKTSQNRILTPISTVLEELPQWKLKLSFSLGFNVSMWGIVWFLFWSVWLVGSRNIPECSFWGNVISSRTDLLPNSQILQLPTISTYILSGFSLKFIDPLLLQVTSPSWFRWNGKTELFHLHTEDKALSSLDYFSQHFHRDVKPHQGKSGTLWNPTEQILLLVPNI